MKEQASYLFTLLLQIFNLKVYIFQGKIVSGFDKTGLADTFVRVVVQDQVKETKVTRDLLYKRYVYRQYDFRR